MYKWRFYVVSRIGAYRLQNVWCSLVKIDVATLCAVHSIYKGRGLWEKCPTLPQVSVRKRGGIVVCTPRTLRVNAVLATATWVGGWLAGWMSHAGIVSIPQNLSLHCALAAAQCIVIGPVCGFVSLCVFVCGSVTTITRNCVHRSSPNWVM